MRGFAVCVALCLGACHGAETPSRVPVAAATLTSNVLRADYAGSRACGDCHGAIYASWEKSPMRNMTRDAATATIQAPFDGAQLHVGTDTITMSTIDGQRAMTIATPTGTTQWRVTKVVGGRYREDFVGVSGSDPVEHVLPATFVVSNHGWRYKGYSVMVRERPAASVKGAWAQECIGCHNTLPLGTYLYDDLFGPSLPAYQGKMSDRVMPPTLAWRSFSRDDSALARALGDEIRYLGGTAPEPLTLRSALPAAATTSEQRLDGKHLVELGIGCEACHNGARVHAAAPDVKPDFAATSPLLRMAPPPGQTGTRAQWINHACAKCHTVLFTQYPWTWEGGKRRGTNLGGSTTTSGEGRDFQLGGCATQMACTTCHDPHTEDPPAKLRELATPAGNHVCTTCHAQYATPAATAAHSHHGPNSAGTSCIACHMAKKNMGLDYALDRYHRIGSPTDAARVEGDRPLECALCHADKGVEALTAQMETWWGKHFDRAKLRALYGADLAVNPLRATLVMGKPHEQAVAISVLGDAKDAAAVELIAPHLAHDYPLVRYFAQRALQTITGDPVAVDVGAPAAAVRTATAQWLARYRARISAAAP